MSLQKVAKMDVQKSSDVGDPHVVVNVCDYLPTVILSLLFTYLDVTSGAQLQCNKKLVKIARLPTSAPLHYEINGVRHFKFHHHWRSPAITLQPRSFTDRSWTRTTDSLLRFSSPRLRKLDIYVAYTFDVLLKLTMVTDLTIRITGYRDQRDDEQACLHRLSELTHLKHLSIMGGGNAGKGEIPFMDIHWENLPVHLTHLSLDRQPLLAFRLVCLVKKLDLPEHMLFSRFSDLRSLGVTCEWFVTKETIDDLVYYIPQLEELTLGECTTTNQRELGARLAPLYSLRTLTFTARATETNRYGRVMEEKIARMDDFVSTAAWACSKLQHLRFVTFQPDESTTHLNLCLLGRLCHLRSLTIYDCPHFIYVLTTTPASSYPLDFRVISSAPVKSHYVVCYRPTDWNDVSCISSNGEIRVRL